MLDELADAKVGLVWHQQIDIRRFVSIFVECFHDHFREFHHGFFKYCLSIHIGKDLRIINIRHKEQVCFV